MKVVSVPISNVSVPISNISKKDTVVFSFLRQMKLTIK